MFYAFRNSDASQDVAISDRRQNPGLPKGVKWVYYASFDTPLKAAIGFDIRDMQRLRTEVRSKGYARIEVRRMMRPA